MRYLSPASLFGGNPDLADKRSLLLQKKKLLTDLELSDDGQLPINNRTFSKNDILEYFETLEDAAIIRHHQAIARDKTLSRFLETARIPLGATFADSDLYTDAAFIAWISPYYYTAFTEAAKYYFQKTDGQALKDLLANPLLLTDYDRERAWFSISQILENNITLLENYRRNASRKNASLDVEGILPLISDQLVTMILLLPKDQFTRVRNTYAFTVMQLAILLFNKIRWRRDLADVWMQKATTLAASENMVDQVTKKSHEMATFKKKRERSWAIRVAVIVGIIVLRIILGEKGCNTSTTNHDYPVYTQLTTIPCDTCPPRR